MRTGPNIVLKAERFYLVAFVASCACTPGDVSKTSNVTRSSTAVEVHWKERLIGDFSFTSDWSYEDNVFKNQFGELTCEVDCSERLSAMLDEDGRIFPDSIEAYYSLFDTTHFYHTLASEAFAYEWVGSDFATAVRTSPRSIEVFSHINVGTHSSLVLRVTGSTCVPIVELNSITPLGRVDFSCTGGRVEFEQVAWDSGMVRAEFDLTFNNPISPDEPLSWKGRIFTPLLDTTTVARSLRYSRMR